MQTGYLYAKFYYDNTPPASRNLLTWPWILGPATADRGGSAHTPADGTRYDDFTSDTLTQLRARGVGSSAALAPYIGWSHHNYGDTAISNFPYSTSRAKTVKERLVAGAWKDGTDRNVWLTEGGYDMTSGPETWAAIQPPERVVRVAAQQNRVGHAINEMSRYNRATDSNEIPIFSQYQLQQITSADSVETGLTEGFLFADAVNNTMPLGPGPPRPLYARWVTLPDELS
jgi:hypothetical protein